MNQMTDFLAQFGGISAELFWRGLLVFMRIGAAMAFLPAFGEQSVPIRVKIALTLAFTAIVAPAAGDFPATSRVDWAMMLAEVVVGLAFGFGLRLSIFALQTAAAIIGQATSLSQLFGGAGPEPMPAIGNLLVISALAIGVSAGLHVHVAKAFIQTYALFPPGESPISADMTTWGTRAISHAFSMAFALSAPYVIAAVLYNVALGVINRALPALMVSFIGAPVLSFGGLALALLTTPALLALWWQAAQSYLAAPFMGAP